MPSFHRVVMLLHGIALLVSGKVEKIPISNVTFYDNMWLDDSGGSRMYTTEGWLSCVNLEGFDDRATSAKWTDKTKHPATFTSKSRIAFYADADCNGKQRNWLIDAPNGFPGNFFLDNIDNQISAFELWPHYRD